MVWVIEVDCFGTRDRTVQSTELWRGRENSDRHINKLLFVHTLLSEMLFRFEMVFWVKVGIHQPTTQTKMELVNEVSGFLQGYWKSC